MTRGLTLDAGALIAFERNDRKLVRLLEVALANELEIIIPAGVLGQVWRDGRTQVRLARLLRVREIEVLALDDREARAAGQLCGLRGTNDVIDAAVVRCARERDHRIATSDPDDMRRLDPTVELIVI